MERANFIKQEHTHTHTQCHIQKDGSNMKKLFFYKHNIFILSL